MNDQEDSLSPESLRSRVDAVDIPENSETLLTFVSDISAHKLKDFRKRTRWTQEDALSGFRPNVVNDSVRRLLAKLAAHYSDRRKSLVFLWLVDHQQLLERVDNEVSTDSLRNDILTLLGDYKRYQVAWVLRFSERESIQQALDDGLWEELQNDESPLVAQHSLRELKTKHAQLQGEKSDLEAEVANLEDDLSKARSTIESQKRDINQLNKSVESLEKEKDTIEAKRDELDEELTSIRDDLKNQKQEKRQARDQLSNLQREMRSALASITNMLDVPSTPKDEPTATAELVVEHIKELQNTRSDLKQAVEDLEEERDQLAPALPHVKRAWKNRLNSFRQEVDKRLGELNDSLDPHTPVKDWKHWLNQERSLILPLLDEIENPREERLADLRLVQNLLELRWYLLEWIKLGILRHIESTSALTENTHD